MRISVAGSGAAALVAGSVLALASTPAHAQQLPLPSSINSPPAGPGTAEMGPQGVVSVHPGMEASVGLGTGFADTYGLGIQGRVGYTFHNGVYLGGAGQYFLGHSINDQQAHAAFIGGEAGYKFFPVSELEIRPYAFLGPSFITQVSNNPAPVSSFSRADLALQPGILGTYHFGDAFVGGDAHVMLFPAPNTVAVMATGGMGF